jgi:hypothetical protein
MKNYYFLVGILKVTNEKRRIWIRIRTCIRIRILIRIRTKMSRIRNTASHRICYKFIHVEIGISIVIFIIRTE